MASLRRARSRPAAQAAALIWVLDCDGFVARVTLAVLLTALLAGCAAPAAQTDSAASTKPVAPFIEATLCHEGGGYVTWNMDVEGEVPPPFEGHNVRDDLGDPPFNGGADRNPIPDENISGAYHGVIHCPAWTLDGVAKENLLIAWVGGRVYPPFFDPAPVERQYAMSVIGVNDADLETLLAERGFPVDPLYSAGLSFDQDVMLSTMSYQIHGDILSLVPVEEYREKPAETIRIWAMGKAPDGKAQPLALDLLDTGGRHLVASNVGHFDHRLPSPAPPAPGIPIHEFPSWALAYRDVTRSFAWGPAVESIDLDAGGHGH